MYSSPWMLFSLLQNIRVFVIVKFTSLAQIKQVFCFHNNLICLDNCVIQYSSAILCVSGDTNDIHVMGNLRYGKRRLFESQQEY